MKKLFAAALCAATLLLCGCARPDTATIMHVTDANGKRARSYVKEPSGNERADEIALRTAVRHFRRQVPKPLKNHRYVVEVDVVGLVEPAWPTPKKDN